MSKTLLDIPFEECYHLIAVHCSREAYQVAYFLNEHLQTKLKRVEKDLDFQYKEITAFYPLFHYFDQNTSIDYYLATNKFEGEIAENAPSKSLFKEKKRKTTHLMPMHKSVDYFLKIEDETNLIDTTKIISTLNTIPQIVTAYEVEVETLKSQENLIFN